MDENRNDAYKTAAIIYLIIFSITLLIVLNLQYFLSHWYYGLALFVLAWLVVNDAGFQQAYLSVFLASVFVGFLLNFSKLKEAVWG